MKLWAELNYFDAILHKEKFLTHEQWYFQFMQLRTIA